MSNAIAVFNELKPHCIALSAISLRKPDDAATELRRVIDVAGRYAPSEIDGNVGNYIFFPLKPLLRFEVSEDVRSLVFELLGWLVQSGWYAGDVEMSHQLIILMASTLSKAKLEALRRQVANMARHFFARAKEQVNSLKSRPTLAMLVVELLKVQDHERESIDLRIASYQAVAGLNVHLDAEAAASFLPGTVSAIVPALLKFGQKDRTTIAGLIALSRCVEKSLTGEVGGYRTEEWMQQAALNVATALKPVMAKYSSPQSPDLLDAVVQLCLTILKTHVDAQIYVEFLARHRPSAIEEQWLDTLSGVLAQYIASFQSTLLGVDEERKAQLLETLTSALPLFDDASRAVFEDEIVSHAVEAIRIQPDQLVKTVADEDCIREPSIENLSATNRDQLVTLLESFTSAPHIEVVDGATLWLATKLSHDVLSIALERLEVDQDLAQAAIVRMAQRRGEDFRYELMNVLYPLLCARNPSPFVFGELARHCGYSDVQAMLVDNADYIINALTLAFHTLDIRPATPRILGLLAQMAPDMVELLDDVVETFFEVLDVYQSYPKLVEGIFAGLSGVVRAVGSHRKTGAFDTNLKALEASYQTQGPTDAKSRDDDAPAPVDHAYEIVLKIVQKAQLFLSHGDFQIKQNILALMSDAVPVVASDENKYLPLVHLYWPQVVFRSDDDNPFVVGSSLLLMARTVDLAGNFMRSRIAADVLPRLEEVLHPAKDKRGNFIHGRRDWAGAGRRHVADGVQALLKSVFESGGLRGVEQARTRKLIEELSPRSEVLRRVLEVADEPDRSEMPLS